MDSRLSIIIPVYNNESYLRPTLQSVLAQTYPDLKFWLSMTVQPMAAWLFVRNLHRKTGASGLSIRKTAASVRPETAALKKRWESILRL